MTSGVIQHWIEYLRMLHSAGGCGHVRCGQCYFWSSEDFSGEPKQKFCGPMKSANPIVRSHNRELIQLHIDRLESRMIDGEIEELLRDQGQAHEACKEVRRVAQQDRH